MNSSLERIRAKIAELEAKLADLRIAERELLALEKLPARKTRTVPGPKRKPKASDEKEARHTIGGRSPTSSASMALFRRPRSPIISGRQAETSTIEPYPFRFKR